MARYSYGKKPMLKGRKRRPMTKQTMRKSKGKKPMSREKFIRDAEDALGDEPL